MNKAKDAHAQNSTGCVFREGKRIAARLSAIARSAGEFLGDRFVFRDFHNMCTRIGIGMDPRTSENWMRAAISYGVFKESPESRTNLKIYERGVSFSEFLSGPPPRFL